MIGIEEIFENARREGRTSLLEYESEEILSAYGIAVAPGFLARSVEEALARVSGIGFPVVVKVMSPQIIHKSDAGAVKVGISDEAELAAVWEEILSSARRYAPQADIKGIYVQKMLSGGREVIVGSSRDPQFGPVVMFGLGGVFVEVLKDVVFRVAPVPVDEAHRMIREIRAFSILQGVRGEKPIDFASLAEVISRISRLVSDYPEIDELDANPVLVDEKGAVALDARIIISPK